MKFIFILAMQCMLSSAGASSAFDAVALKRVLSKYQSMSSLQVAFKQTKTLKDIQLKLESEGVLKVQLPNKVEWKITKPQPLEMMLDQETITLSSDGKTSVFRMSEGSTKDQRAFHAMLNWLRLDADALLKDYDVTELGKNRYRFAAKKGDTGMKALIMTVNKNGHVETLTFEEIAGDEILIRFGAPKVVYASRL